LPRRAQDAEPIEKYFTHYQYFRELPLNARRQMEQYPDYVHVTVRVEPT
jgi:hypothetical protein